MPHYPLPLFSMLIFLASAVCFAFITRHFKISQTLGYLFAGVVVGPFGLGLVPDKEHVYILGDVGVLFLLFKVGLELPFHRLQALRTYVFGLGSAQMVLTTLLFTLVLKFFFGFSLYFAIFIGASLALSSTALIIQMLAERGELSSRLGRVSFSVLLFQDLAVVCLFVLVALEKDTGIEFSGSFTWPLLKACGGLVILVMVSRFLIEPLFHLLSSARHPDLFTAGVFMTCFGMSYIACQFNLPTEIGAFLAGLALSETVYRHAIETDIKPIQRLLLGFFFMIVGLEINFNFLLENLKPISLALVAVIASKCLILTILGRFFRLNWMGALKLGLLLSGCGEFIFILFSYASVQKGLDSYTVQFLFVITPLSMILTPFLSWVGNRLSQRFEKPKESSPAPFAHASELPDLKNHVIIAGFGRVGKMVGDILSQNMISYLAVDYDIERVKQLSALRKYPLVHGDSRDFELFKSLGIEKARVVLITFPQVSTALEVIHYLQEHHPNIEICVRIHDHEHARHLIGTGVHLAIPETVESGLQLASMTLQALGFSPVYIEKILGVVHRSSSKASS
ncbi:MAG: cation:proton antiporter [Alphaproteobacteria bacterium]